MHILETIALTFSLADTYLLVRNSLWNWIFGIVAVSLYFFIFLASKLYADMCLQIFYFIFQFYGLYRWSRGKSTQRATHIKRANYLTCILGLLVGFGLFFIIVLMLRYTDSVTVYRDAFVAAFSLIAFWFTSQRYLEHWLFWIMVDSVAFALYYHKSLYLTSGLYALFLVLGILGYMRWKQKICAPDCKSTRVNPVTLSNNDFGILE